MHKDGQQPEETIIYSIQIVTTLDADGNEGDYVKVEASDGSPIPLRTALGSLEMAKDTLIRRYMEEE